MVSDADIAFATIETAISKLRAGGIIILVDDEDRENEGDFVMAAEFITSEAITLMTREGSGIITVPMEQRRLDQLGLDLMVLENTESLRTAFTVTVDAVAGTTTGSSAHDRAQTIRMLANPLSAAKDFNRPGHVNPLMSRQGGVLKRPGHTEAAVDFMRLSGLHTVGVISEIMGDDGEMLRLPALAEMARRLDMPLVSIADLIAYRRRTEKLVHRIATTKLPTLYGTFTTHAYLSDVDDNEYLALCMGDVTGDEPVLTRIHSSCVTGDLLGSLRCDCGDQLDLALAKISSEGRGVLLYIEQEGRGIGLVNKMRAYALQDEGVDTLDANLRLGFPADARDYGIGAQILVDLGLKRLMLMTNNPAKRDGIDGFGLEITERVPLPIEPNEHNRAYMETKRRRMGHLLFDASTPNDV